MTRTPNSLSRAGVSHGAIPVGRLAHEVLTEYQTQLDARAIAVELDLEADQPAMGTPQLRGAISALIEQAIDAMPEGGELSLTLVTGPFQWELEIADTGRPLPTEPNSSTTSADASAEEAPRILELIPFRRQSCLERARQQARELGLMIESWNCPQGGTAWVLVCPVTPSQRQAG